MPFATLERSPVWPACAPARVHCRDAGAGPAVVLLHGGWGYEPYPFEAAMATLSATHRTIAPDRVGYGRSDAGAGDLPRDFHRRMADETVLLLDALGVERAALWGHSDGAVVAAWTAILHPDRVHALVLEALHFRAAKPASLGFFRDGIEAPERFGDAVVEALVRDHGPERWRHVVARGSRIWLAIIEEGLRTGADLYDGRLPEVRAPTLLLHGSRDPRTEPGELEAARDALPHADVALLYAGHSPHTSGTSGARAVARAAAFLADAC
jgi:3-oxoadipate enol-lactonase